jgi:D-aminopeptidase
MVCHEFKGGIGTASRRLGADAGSWTVGALVQANYGRRELLRIDGVPVGSEIPVEEVPSPWRAMPATGASPLSDGSGGHLPAPGRRPPGSGSIIVVLATDAPLLPHQCARLAQRAGLGLARLGSIAGNSSGDLFIAFATGNRDLPRAAFDADPRREMSVRYLNDSTLDPLFQAAVETTEESVVNALLTAGTVTGCDGVTALGLDGERVVDIMARYGRGPRT